MERQYNLPNTKNTPFSGALTQSINADVQRRTMCMKASMLKCINAPEKQSSRAAAAWQQDSRAAIQICRHEATMLQSCWETNC